MRLVLASASPRRAELLRAAGYEFDVRPVDVDERVRPAEAPADYVARVAREKARVCASEAPELKLGPTAPDRSVLVLAADTAVVVDGRILGKPSDEDEGRAMLRMLSGRSHEVLTGVCAYAPGFDPECRVDTTIVWFSRLTADEIEWYVASREGMDKAGGYGIQGLASRFIPRIDGSYSNVVGLPLAVVHELTTRFAVPRFR